MNADSRRARSIFLKAVEERRPDQWEAYLDETCGSDSALRNRVEALLKAHGENNSLLDVPAGALVATIDRQVDCPLAERPGTLIGPYKLLEQIGEGGFGVVFMAEQQQPVRRKVALKVLKPGMDTRQVVARFEAERQALALMDHPNIAHVFDGGTTETGRPYFVMELVRGVPVTEFCDQSCLGIRQRLELFVHVCQAVQHAHQKGVIHRDIKPTNVMVTLHDGQPVAKVIDFGIAKAMGQQLTEKTLFTNFAQLIGTPLYMSPEQAEMSGLDVDTRSDIYSLGVLLYELLTGTTPFENERLSKVGYDEMRRIIREEEPPKPSTRISTVGKAAATASQQRQADPRKLSRLFRGELDWIVMKALEKDRNRRYETANGFARDVQRYLNDEPVVACPASAAYRLRKLARRHKRALASAAVLAVAGLVIAATIGWAVRDRDAHAKEAAQESAARRLAVEQAVGRALEQADELQKQGNWQEALVAVERAEAALASGEAGSEARKQVDEQLADLRLIQRLDEIRAQEKETEHEHQHRAYAGVFADFGIDVESLSPPEVAARIQRRPSITIRMAAALDDWAILLRDWGLHDPTRDPATWKRLLEAARLADPDPWRSQLRQLMGQEDLNALWDLAETSDISALPVQSLRLMGTALIFGGDAKACVAWLRRAHRRHPADALIAFDLLFHLSNLPGADWVEVLRFAEAGLAARPIPDMYLWVAGALMRLGRVDEAMGCYQTVVELHPNNAKALSALGQIHARKGRWKQAAASLARAVELDPKDNWSAHQLGIVLAEQGDLPAYQRFCDTMLSRWDTVTDPTLAERTAKACLLLPGGIADPERLAPLIQTALSADQKDELYVWFLFAQRLYDYRCGRFAEARTACRNGGQRAVATNELLLVQDQSIEAMSLSRLGQTDEARQVLASAGRRLYEKRQEFGSGDLREWWTALLCARVLLREAEETMGTRWPEAIEVAPNDANGHSDLGQIYARRGQWKEAAAAFDRALAIDPANFGNWSALATVRAEMGDLEGYGRTCAKMVQQFGDSMDAPTAERTAKACLLLPDALDAGDFERAQILAERAVTGTENHPYYRPFAMAKGLADYRAGRYAESIKWIELARPAVEGNPWDSSNFSVLAMAHHVLGNEIKAAAALANAQAIIAKAPDPSKGQLFGADDWHQWLPALVLFREAERLVVEVRAAHHYVHLSQWDNAAAEYAKADLLARPLSNDAFAYACLFLIRGDLAGYDRFCQDMIQRAAEIKNPYNAYVLARSCAVARHGPVEPARMVEWANQAVASDHRPWRLYVLGLAQYRAGQFDEALQSFTLAKANVGIWGESDVTWFGLALVHHHLGRPDEARQCLDRGIEWLQKVGPPSAEQPAKLPPQDWIEAELLRHEAEELLKAMGGFSKATEHKSQDAGLMGMAGFARGRFYAERGEWDKAEADFAVTAGSQPQNAAVFLGIGATYAQFGRWGKAAAAYHHVLEMKPSDHCDWVRAAALRLYSGDVEGFRKIRRTMLERFCATDRPEIAERTAKVCLLLPDPGPDIDQAVKLASVATTGNEKHDLYWFFMLCQGLADCRAGRHAAAVEWMKRFSPAVRRSNDAETLAAYDVTGFAILSLAHRGLGQQQEAVAALGTARAILANHFPDPDQGPPWIENWQDWLQCRILCREAEELLEKPPTETAP